MVAEASDDALMNTRETCKFLHVDVATLYRGVRSGRYPKPIKISPNRNRWLKSECLAAIERLKRERDDG